MSPYLNCRFVCFLTDYFLKGSLRHEKKIGFCLFTPYDYNKTPKAGNFTNRDVVCLMVWKPQVLDGFSPGASGEDLGRDNMTKTGTH